MYRQSHGVRRLGTGTVGGTCTVGGTGTGNVVSSFSSDEVERVADVKDFMGEAKYGSHVPPNTWHPTPFHI